MPYLRYEGPGDIYDVTEAGLRFHKFGLPVEVSDDLAASLILGDLPNIFTRIDADLAEAELEADAAANAPPEAAPSMRVTESAPVAAQTPNTSIEPKSRASAPTKADSGGE